MVDNRKQKIQTLVHRLISGARNPRDLDELFLWLRSRSHGLRCIVDIGDFVAHSDERQKGFVWETGSHLFRMFRQIQKTYFHKIPPSEEGLSQYKDSVLSIFLLDENKHFDDSILRNRKKAKKYLKSALEKMIFHNERYECFDLTNTEAHVVNYYTSIMIVRPAFDSKTLFNEFETSLIKNGLIEQIENQNAQNIENFLSIYALEKMHNCILEFEGSRIEIFISTTNNNSGPKKLNAVCHIPNLFSDREYNFVVGIFQTDCLAEEFLDPEIIENLQDSEISHPVEIGLNGTLVKAV